MFNYLAKCGWLFDGFFSHGQLAVESILHLANSTIRRRIFGSGAGPRPLGGAAHGHSAACHHDAGGPSVYPGNASAALKLMCDWSRPLQLLIVRVLCEELLLRQKLHQPHADPKRDGTAQHLQQRNIPNVL